MMWGGVPSSLQVSESMATISEEFEQYSSATGGARSSYGASSGRRSSRRTSANTSRNRKNGSLTEEDLANMDPQEAKKHRRLMRNRLSAQLHRERQRCFVEGLQTRVAALMAEREGLLAVIQTAAARAPQAFCGLRLPRSADEVAPNVHPPNAVSRDPSSLPSFVEENIDRFREELIGGGVPVFEEAKAASGNSKDGNEGGQQVTSPSQRSDPEPETVPSSPSSGATDQDRQHGEIQNKDNLSVFGEAVVGPSRAQLAAGASDSWNWDALPITKRSRASSIGSDLYGSLDRDESRPLESWGEPDNSLFPEESIGGLFDSERERDDAVAPAITESLGSTSIAFPSSAAVTQSSLEKDHHLVNSVAPIDSASEDILQPVMADLAPPRDPAPQHWSLAASVEPAAKRARIWRAPRGHVDPTTAPWDSPVLGAAPAPW